MTSVRRLLQTKGHAIWSVSPDDTVFSALRLMAEKNIGALVVLENAELVGIFSERDFARKACVRGDEPLNAPVRDFMTSPVYTISPAATINEVMALMTEKRIRHLPIVNEGRLVGVISIGDVVKEIISDHQFVIENLEKYITGRK